MDDAPEGCTITPNWLFDEVVQNGTCAQLKVTATVIRYTIGMGHREAKLSDAFLGWCTSEGPLSLDRGIDEAVKRGFISRRRFDSEWAYRVVDLTRFSLGTSLSEEVYLPPNKKRQLPL
jgi:hypothetical protein